MFTTIKKGKVDVLAGLVTWAVVSGIVLWVISKNPRDFMAMMEPTIALLLVYLGAMLYACNDEKSLQFRRTAHAVQLIAIVTLASVVSIDFLQIYTIIWIAIVPSLYSMRTSVLAVPVLCLGWYFMLSWHWQAPYAVTSTALYATFHLFALFSARSAREAEKARDQTQALNAELVATQHLLSEASRQSERTRIARDLHDLVGHHLTALSINLQIAERMADGDLKGRIEQSRGLARLLLSDVRDAVSTLRDQGQIDLRRSLELLVENVPRLDITLEIAPSVVVENVEVADAIIRCVQEALTNSLRHSKARHSWIEITQESQAVRVEVRDDGGTTELCEGNGLKGMRERLKSVGGTLAIEPNRAGVAVRAQIPLAA
ncbi:MAG: sensor histidine kinase [Pseudomonadota bacterium]